MGPLARDVTLPPQRWERFVLAHTHERFTPLIGSRVLATVRFLLSQPSSGLQLIFCKDIPAGTKPELSWCLNHSRRVEPPIRAGSRQADPRSRHSTERAGYPLSEPCG